MKRIAIALFVFLLLISSSRIATVSAQTAFLYANNATSGTPYVYKLNPSTMAVLDTYSPLNSINGRGAAVVGNILYYTTATSNNVYKYNTTTHTDLGVAFSVAGTTALANIAYDGTNFWIGDYSGTNHAFLYTPTGTLLKTISLVNCVGFCVGLEYFVQNNQGRLISNRSDSAPSATYDIYDTNGTLLTPGFISTGTFSTGIGFDGTNFYVANVNAGTISKYNGSTGALISTTAITGFGGGQTPTPEDLSADIVQVTPPPPGVPTLSEWGLAICMLLLVGVGLHLIQRPARRA